MPKIKTATWPDKDRVAGTMTLAFSADPVARWLLPDPHRHISTFIPFVSLFGGKAFEHGSAYVIGEFSGVALWLPPGAEPDDEPITELFRQNISEPTLGAIFSIFEQMASFHPREPHWYLPLIGVEPIFQGQGYGSELMRHALVACDRDQKLAYLESTNPANLPLYKRHGFDVVGEIRAEDSPPMYPMLREPH